MAWIYSLIVDIRHALRSLRFNPVFSATAILTLGLGIAAATSVISIVDATLLRPLPFPGSNRVVDLSGYSPKMNDVHFGLTRRETEVLRSGRSFEAVSEYDTWGSRSYTMARSDGAAVFRGVVVSSSFFAVMGVHPAIGRAFGSEDENTDRPRVCVLTHAGWQRLSAGRRDPIGQSLSFVEGPLTVVGVMPEGFWYPMATSKAFGMVMPDLIVPTSLRAAGGGPSSVHVVLARLKPGVSILQAQAEADVVARQYGELQEDGSGLGMRVTLLQQLMSREARPTLLILFGVVGCLLLICCVNIASLLLSRSHARAKEIAMRATLGAGRARLLRQMFTEHMVLAVMGGGLGLFLTGAALDVFLGLLPKQLLIVQQIDLDARMLSLATLITLLTGVLCGLGPAFAGTRVDLMYALKGSSPRLVRAVRRRFFGRGLLIVEAALLVVLLSGAALLLNTLVRLQVIDVGFDSRTLWAAEFEFAEGLYPETAQIPQFLSRMNERLRAIPGVVSVGEGDWGPLGGFCPGNELGIEGKEGTLSPQLRHVSADYFASLDLAPLRGRLWTRADEGEKPHVAVINQNAARSYFPNEDPLGRRIVINRKWPVQIVGIVRDLREANERKSPGPSVYVPINPYSTEFYRSRIVLLRFRDDRPALRNEIIRNVAAVDPRMPVTVTRMDETLSQRLRDPLFYAVFVGLAAAFGLLLAGVGIAGVAGQGVVQRTHEIGVRLALGADVAGVVRMIVREVCIPVLAGIGAGCVCALAAARVLRSLLYEITPQDPATHAIAVGLLLGIALLAAYIPARRASRINPVDALRAE
jgi:putative ABC transport system permease protein